MIKAALSLYTRSVLDYPRSTLAAVFVLIGLACTGLPNFHVDASGDSLLLESDKALDFYREVRETYGSEDYIILTYEPHGDLFSDASLETLKKVTKDIRELEQVSSVNSILNVPLFETPPLTREELAEGTTYLLSEHTDRKRAEKELTEAERETLASLKEKIDQARYEWNRMTRETIDKLEAITERYSDEVRMLVGGLPAINIYMLDYIRHDLVVFGAALGLMLVVILAIIFGKPRWVVVPLGVCGAAMLTMAGVLGLAGWPVTVVSSNFMALILILTLSLTIHLAVRYRELRGEIPQAKQRTIVRKMVQSKFLPSLLTALTTMVAFASLIVSDIRPVIDFGWMMVAGIAVGFLLTFLMLPPALMLVTRGKKASENPITDRITGVLSSAIRRFPLSIAYKRMPEDVKAAILDPYLSDDGDQARIAARVYETRPELERAELLERIRTFVTEEVGINAERVHVTGLFVLYNNVLKSLLRSQVFTAVTVMVAVMLMFWISFRSPKVAVLATIPNLAAAVLVLVLAIMSAAGLPLDIMTITIAAVAIGIGVDDTIHYVHRYRAERPRHDSADAAIKRCHDSVGRAIYFTSLVIVLGFSVLALSKFVPSVYFGLLIGAAMVVALVANLTLLPLLLARFGAFER